MSVQLRNNSKWLILVTIGAGTFMSALDISIVNSILPVISKSINSTIAEIEWIVIIYLVLVSGLLPSFGRLGDIKGHKNVYISGFLLFILGSIFCALSPTIWGLIFARGIQAIGAAMLSSNSPAIITKNFPAQQRGQALGLTATMTYLGLTLGPTIGGLLTELYSWRSVFLINIPVGLLAVFLSFQFLPQDDLDQTSHKFDLVGAFNFLAGLICFLLALNQGPRWGWLSRNTISLILLSLLLFISFIRNEKHISDPMLELSLFKNPIISSTITAAVLNYICVYSNIFLLPFYLIQAREFSPSQAGLIISTQSLVMAFVAPISGTLSDRYGNRWAPILGMGIIAFGILILSRLSSTSTVSYIITSLVILGLGMGMFITPNSSALLGAAPTKHYGIVAGLLATARNVGMALGIGISGAVMTSFLHNPSNLSPIPLIPAIQNSYLAAFFVAILGILITSIRSNPQKIYIDSVEKDLLNG